MPIFVSIGVMNSQDPFSSETEILEQSSDPDFLNTIAEFNDTLSDPNDLSDSSNVDVPFDDELKLLVASKWFGFALDCPPLQKILIKKHQLDESSVDESVAENTGDDDVDNPDKRQRIEDEEYKSLKSSPSKRRKQKPYELSQLQDRVRQLEAELANLRKSMNVVVNTNTRKDRVMELVSAFNRRNIVDLKSQISCMFTADCELITPSLLEDITGHKFMELFWTFLLETFPDARIELDSITQVNSNVIHCIWRFIGTRTAKLPADLILAKYHQSSSTSSQAVTMKARIFFFYEGNGLVSKLVCLWNTHTLLYQLLGLKEQSANKSK